MLSLPKKKGTNQKQKISEKHNQRKKEKKQHQQMEQTPQTKNCNGTNSTKKKFQIAKNRKKLNQKKVQNQNQNIQSIMPCSKRIAKNKNW